MVRDREKRRVLLRRSSPQVVFILIMIMTLLSSRLLSMNLTIKIYKTVILPVVLYSCEEWSLILMEERRLRVFENRILKRIFGSKRNENW